MVNRKHGVGCDAFYVGVGVRVRDVVCFGLLGFADPVEGGDV